MDFKRIAIENDIYLQLWVKHLKPIYDSGSCYADFLQTNEHWVGVSATEIEKNKMFLVGKVHAESTRAYDANVDTHGEDVDTRIKKISVWEKFLDMTDSLFRSIFEPITLREYERLNKPWGIVINEHMLKFHRNDARKEIRDQLMKS